MTTKRRKKTGSKDPDAAPRHRRRRPHQKAHVIRAEVLKMTEAGATQAEIAESLGISRDQVRKHLDVGLQAVALSLRLQGKNYRQISEEAGLTGPEHARRLVKAELEYLDDEAEDTAARLKRIQHHRLEAWHALLWQSATEAEDTSIVPTAARAAVHIMREQNKLHGIYPQAETLLEQAMELLQSIGQNIAPTALARFRDALFRRMVRRGDPLAAQQYALFAGMDEVQKLPPGAYEDPDGRPDTGGGAATPSAPQAVLVLPEEQLLTYQRDVAAAEAGQNAAPTVQPPEPAPPSENGEIENKIS
jgi:predicted transcriptional regulator